LAQALGIPDVRPGSIAAFSVPQDADKSDYSERLAIVVELRNNHRTASARGGEAHGRDSDSAAPAQKKGPPLSIKLGMALLRALDKLPDSVSGFLVRGAGVLMRTVSDCRRKLTPAKEDVDALEDGDADYTHAELTAIATAVRTAVFKGFQIPVFDFVLARQGSVLKTSSGKVRRSETKALLRDGKVSILFRSKAGEPSAVRSHVTLSSSNSSDGSLAAASASASAASDTHPLSATAPPQPASGAVAAWVLDPEAGPSRAATRAPVPVLTNGDRSLEEKESFDDSLGDDAATTAAREAMIAEARSTMSRFFPGNVLPDVKDITQDMLEVVIAGWLKEELQLIELPDRKVPLDQLGMDSVMGMKMTSQLTQVFSVPVNMYAFLDDLTVAGAANVVHKLITGTMAMTATSTTNVTASSYDDIITTDDESQPVAHILGLGSAVPKTCGPQNMIIERMSALMGLSAESADKFRRIGECSWSVAECWTRSLSLSVSMCLAGEGSGVAKRHMVFSDLESALFHRRGLHNDAPMEERNSVYIQEAPKLARAAAEAAVKDWGGNKKDITHVVGVTCTGAIIPGLAFHVMEGLG
jgi:acyl carrier protein